MVGLGQLVRVRIDNGVFDDQFFVTGAPSTAVRTLLDEAMRARLLALRPLAAEATPYHRLQTAIDAAFHEPGGAARMQAELAAYRSGHRKQIALTLIAITLLLGPILALMWMMMR